jgi:hypothetical protein
VSAVEFSSVNGRSVPLGPTGRCRFARDRTARPGRRAAPSDRTDLSGSGSGSA